MIKKIKKEELAKLVDKYSNGIKYTYEELDDFYCENDDGIFTACFNSSGDCFCEDYKSYDEMLKDLGEEA